MDFAKDVLGDDQVKSLRNEGLSDLQIAKKRVWQAQVAVDFEKRFKLTQAQEGKTDVEVMKELEKL